MTIDKKIILAVIEYHMVITQLYDTIHNKELAVREQDFESASKLRVQETNLRKNLPKISDWSALKDELLKANAHE